MEWTGVIEQFHAYMLLERGLSQHTIEAYERDITVLGRFLMDRPVPVLPLMVEGEHIREFIGAIQLLGLAETSQSRILSAIRAFYKFLLIEDFLVVDPTEYIEFPRLPRKMPDILTVEEINSMIQVIDHSDPNGVRNRAMVETLYACGLRVSELVDLRMHHYFPDDGYIKVLGKNNKERLVPISAPAVQHIEYYKNHVRAFLPAIKPGSENVLFLNRRGGKMSRVMVFYIVKELAKAAGIHKNISPHTFRHTFATHLVEGGADLKAVQDMLGHESITTTEIYTHLDTSYLRDTIYRFHPRAVGV